MQDDEGSFEGSYRSLFGALALSAVPTNSHDLVHPFAAEHVVTVAASTSHWDSLNRTSVWALESHGTDEPSLFSSWRPPLMQ
jgi:hypothetical protein